MRRISDVLKISMFALTAFAFQSCQKNNGIDNNQVITKPFTMYIIDSLGTIYNTNDGSDYKQIIFPADGIPPRSLVTSGTGMIMIKSSPNAFMSTNEGKQFNITYNRVNSSAFHSSMILDVPSFNNRVYMASSDGKGIVYAEKVAVDDTWITDNDNGLDAGASITSFTQLENGKLVAFDDPNRAIYVKDDVTTGWTKKLANGLPTGTGQFFISHYGDNIIAADATGADGVWFSTDQGDNWTQYSGLPANVAIHSVYAPFEKALIVGLEGYGAYRLPLGSTTFQSSSIGFDVNTTVRSIVGKYNYYKNDSKVEYVYVAANTGIYVSRDNGSNWTKLKTGNFYLIN